MNFFKFKWIRLVLPTAFLPPILALVSCSPTPKKHNADQAAVDQAINSLSAEDFANLCNAQALSSSISAKDVYIVFFATRAIANLTNAQKNLIKQADLTIEPQDGQLVIHIAHHGVTKTILLKGFLSQASVDAEAVTKVIQNLNVVDFTPLVAAQNLSSSVTSRMVYDQLLTLAPVIKLQPQQKALILKTDINLQPQDGELVINIANHGPTKTLLLKGFLTQASADAQAVMHVIQNLKVNDFAQLANPLFLSQSITKQQVYDALLALPTVAQLSSAQRSLITLQDFNLEALDTQLVITINHHGVPKKLNIEGFLSKSSADATKVQDFVQSLTAHDFATLINAKSLSTSVTKEAVFQTLMSLEAVNNLTNDQKQLLVIEDIQLKSFDGSLNLVFTNHGPEHVIVLKGYLTQADRDAQETTKAIQNLNIDNFKSLINPHELSSSVLKEAVLNLLLSQVQISKLTGDQKNLISDHDLIIHASDGSLQIIIQNHGPEKVFLLSGFLTQANKDALAVKNFIQNLGADNFKALINPQALSSTISPEQVYRLMLTNDDFLALTETQKALLKRNDVTVKALDGALQIKLLNHGADKLLVLPGFLTQADADAQKVTSTIQSLTKSDFATLINPQSLSSAISSQDVYYILIDIEEIKALTETQRSLINLEDIKVKPFDGALEITIMNHGAPKILRLTGFLTNADHDVLQTNEAIQALTSADFLSLVNANVFSSTITIDRVYNKLLTTDVISKLSPTQKALIVLNNLKLKALDGALEIEINNHGPKKIILIEGFLTQANADAQAVSLALQGLTLKDFQALIDPQKLSSSITIDQVYKQLLLTNTFNTLTSQQKQLIVKTDFVLHPTDGALQIVIKNHGLDKIITLNGFLTQASANAQIVKAAIQNLSINDFWLLQDSKVMSSDVSLEKVYYARLAADGIKNLTSAQKNLISRQDITLQYLDGELKIIISNHGPDNIIIVQGFLTQDNANVQKVNAAIANLSDADFAILANSNVLSSSITTTQVYNVLMATDEIKNLSDDQQALIQASDIELQPLDGALEIVIVSHGINKVINVQGFLSQADINNQAVNQAIANLTNNDFLTLVNANVLSSNITLDAVYQTLLKATPIAGLSPRQKGLITANDLTLQALDGKLEIIIANHGADRIFILDGFLTQASANAQAINNAISQINANTLGPLVDSNKKSGDITPDQVYNLILQSSIFSQLTPDQKALLNLNDIALNALWFGRLRVIIKNHGEDQVITLSGFKWW